MSSYSALPSDAVGSINFFMKHVLCNERLFKCYVLLKYIVS